MLTWPSREQRTVNTASRRGRMPPLTERQAPQHPVWEKHKLASGSWKFLNPNLITLLWVTTEGCGRSLWFRLRSTSFKSTLGFFVTRWVPRTKSERGKDYSHLSSLLREITRRHKSIRQSIWPARSSSECPGESGTAGRSCGQRELSLGEKTVSTGKLGWDFYPSQLPELLRFSVFSG